MIKCLLSALVLLGLVTGFCSAWLTAKMRRALKQLPEFADLDYAMEDKGFKYLGVKYPPSLQNDHRWCLIFGGLTMTILLITCAGALFCHVTGSCSECILHW
jgi:hypothetical protein